MQSFSGSLCRCRMSVQTSTTSTEPPIELYCLQMSYRGHYLREFQRSGCLEGFLPSTFHRGGAIGKNIMNIAVILSPVYAYRYKNWSYARVFHVNLPSWHDNLLLMNLGNEAKKTFYGLLIGVISHRRCYFKRSQLAISQEGNCCMEKATSNTFLCNL